MAARLARKGSPANQKTVATSMLRRGIDTCHRLDRVHLQRDQGPADKVWISDITYLQTNVGWLYVCAVRDGCSPRMLGCALDSVQNTDLVEHEPCG